MAATKAAVTLVVAVEAPSAAVASAASAVVGCDAFAGDDTLRDTVDGPKWLQVDARTLVAYAGSFALGRALEHGPRPPVRRARERVDRYVYRLARSIWTAATAAGVPRDEGELLLAHEGKVWVDAGGGAIVRSGWGYAAIGAGAPQALAVLAAVEGAAEGRVRAALRATARHCPQVSEPFWVTVV